MKNLMSMMKQAQEMQTKMQEQMETIKSDLERIEVEGQSGAGLVKVTAAGNGQIKAIKIDPSLADADELDVLEDLLVAACNDVKAKAEQAHQEKMGELSQGLGLPAGLKLPF